MKKPILYLLLVLYAMLVSCQQDSLETPIKNGIPEDIISKLQEAGFDTSEGIRKYRDGYLVEYDIYLTPKQINELVSFKSDPKQGRVKHYRTYELVAGIPRTLYVYFDPGFDSYMQNSFDDALNRYNSLGVGLSFQRTYSHADISIYSFYEESNVLGFSSGFPSGGNPANAIYLNTFYYNGSEARPDATTVIAHEIGHAIGFRHTDFMDRAFSCGWGGNEGDGGVGAVHIPGTSTGPSGESWMLACSSNTDRPFTGEDITAIANTYPNGVSVPCSQAPIGKVIALKAVVNNKYVVAENNGNASLIANRDAIGEWEMFHVVDAGGGYFALVAQANYQYVCAESQGGAPLIANRGGIGLWEQFCWIENGDGTISIRAAVNNKFVCAENAGASNLIANRDAIGLWEMFTWEEVH